MPGYYAANEEVRLAQFVPSATVVSSRRGCQENVRKGGIRIREDKSFANGVNRTNTMIKLVVQQSVICVHWVIVVPLRLLHQENVLQDNTKTNEVKDIVRCVNSASTALKLVVQQSVISVPLVTVVTLQLTFR